MKVGFYYERMARNVSVYSHVRRTGSYYFGSDTANPIDTGYGYSNLLLGSVQAYGEDNTRFIKSCPLQPVRVVRTGFLEESAAA